MRYTPNVTNSNFLKNSFFCRVNDKSGHRAAGQGSRGMNVFTTLPIRTNTSPCLSIIFTATVSTIPLKTSAISMISG